MKRKSILKCGLIFLTLYCLLCLRTYSYGADNITLPKPDKKGNVSVEETINMRRSLRSFSSEALTLKEVSQVLWAAGGETADGITGPTRSYPSARAIYPLDIYLVAGNVEGLKEGIYEYEWKEHMLIPVKDGDHREELSRAAMNQQMIAKAPVTVVILAREEEVESRYGEKAAMRYISMDAGHLGQNVHLQTESLGLGTVMVGSFSEKEVNKVMGTEKKIPVYMMPIGRRE
ncbi:MAG: SagB/ThcOx family dehydrogenase [Candidatus Omnitrophota bacterium]